MGGVVYGDRSRLWLDRPITDCRCCGPLAYYRGAQRLYPPDYREAGVAASCASSTPCGSIGERCSEAIVVPRVRDGATTVVAAICDAIVVAADWAALDD